MYFVQIVVHNQGVNNMEDVRDVPLEIVNTPVANDVGDFAHLENAKSHLLDVCEQNATFQSLLCDIRRENISNSQTVLLLFRFNFIPVVCPLCLDLRNGILGHRSEHAECHDQHGDADTDRELDPAGDGALNRTAIYLVDYGDTQVHHCS